MEYTIDKGCHAVHLIQFHLIMCTKHRKELLEGDLDTQLKKLILDISNKAHVRIIQQKSNKDHIHIVFIARPSLTPSIFINTLKSVTSRKLRKEFPDLIKNHLNEGEFWGPSYFLASNGQITLEAVKDYVETQQKVETVNNRIINYTE